MPASFILKLLNYWCFFFNTLKISLQNLPIGRGNNKNWLYPVHACTCLFFKFGLEGTSISLPWRHFVPIGSIASALDEAGDGWWRHWPVFASAPLLPVSLQHWAFFFHLQILLQPQSCPVRFCWADGWSFPSLYLSFWVEMSSSDELLLSPVLLSSRFWNHDAGGFIAPTVHFIGPHSAGQLYEHQLPFLHKKKRYPLIWERKIT